MLTFGVFLVVGLMTTQVLAVVIKHRAKLTCMVGMMVAMTMGMMAGLAVGTILGTHYTQDLFTSAVLSMVVGVAAGAVTGFPISVMAVLDGLMAGIMGGMMGAMLGQMLLYNHPDLIALIMLAAFIGVVQLLLRMLNEEIGAKGQRELTDAQVKKGVAYMALGAAALVVFTLLSTDRLTQTRQLPGTSATAEAANPSALLPAPPVDNPPQLSTPPESSPPANGAAQNITIRVGQGTYTPEQVVLKKGVRVRLTLTKDYSGGCQSIFVARDFGVQTYVKQGSTTVEFTPNKEGQFPFSCGMGMFGGTFVVKG